MQSSAKTVDEYLKEQPEDRRAVLVRLRKLIRESLPSAVESMRYGMASFDVGDTLCSLAAQKNYFALYVDPVVVARHKAKLGKVSVGKSCIRFKKLEDLSLETVEQVLKEAGQRRAEGMTSSACGEACG
jgi:uncharacterized protein YdhG (YjbR/CyaY superfamily)